MSMDKICPFMSRPENYGVDDVVYPKRWTNLVGCLREDCMAWFPGWKDSPDSAYCQLIVNPSRRD